MSPEYSVTYLSGSSSTTIPLETKKPILKAVVYDEKTDRVGSKAIILPEEKN